MQKAYTTPAVFLQSTWQILQLRKPPVMLPAPAAAGMEIGKETQ